jgi:hypothetical protein
MTLRVLALALAIAPMLLLGTLAPVAASSGCEEAKAALDAEAQASHYTFTPAVALALKNAVEACPAETGPGLNANLPATSGPTPPPPPDGHVKINRGLKGATCGYTELSTGHHPDAPLTAYGMVVVYTESTDENGPADVTYNPTTDVASYTVRGPTYGLSVAGKAGANGAASGHIFAYGIPIPADLATADAGCGANNPSLCWGFGYAQTFIGSVGLVVKSAFNHCDGA